MEWLPGKWLEISPISPALRLVWIGTSTVEAPTTASIGAIFKGISRFARDLVLSVIPLYANLGW
jgi:hypothetical protein